ncbi:MAG: hypothetical protein ABMA02_06610 [Saprospiraceae bacterium]
MQRKACPFFTLLALGLCLTALTIYLGYKAEQSEFSGFLLAYGVFFAIYAWLLFRRPITAEEQRWLVGLGIVLRAVLLFSIPNLSDDFYRFLWDGRLAAQGIHPFAHPPFFFMENPAHLVGITPELFQKLNSPQYHTVYPPVCQGVFWLAAKIFPESISGGVFVLKLFLFACELGTLAVLAFFSNKQSGAAGNAPVAYALNPLAILEITGNGHFEGAMLCFLLAGLAALWRGRLLWGALFWALAVASKLVPLLFLPIVLAWLGWRAGLRFVGLFTLFCAALFLPLLDLEILANMAASLNLYFRQFAFNASGYYLLKAVGKAIAPPTLDIGRTLGPILGAVVFLGVLALAFFRRKKNDDGLAEKCLLASALYLALATTVHPWYIVLPFGLGLLTRWQFPLVWTAAAALSYSHYASGGFQENYGLIALEYTLVTAFAAWEFFNAPQIFTDSQVF